MKITQVEYRKLESLGNYNNHTFGAHADVEDGEDPKAALESLKRWVDEQLRHEIVVAEERREFEHESRSLQGEIGRYETMLALLKERWDKAKAFLESHGVDTSRYCDPDLPF